MALLMPLLLLIFGGGLVLGLALQERGQLRWAAQEAAYAAAIAGAEDSACDDARLTAGALLGRTYAACDGSDGLAMVYDPAGTPPTVGISLDGSTWTPPLMDPVTVAGRAAAVIREGGP